MPKNQPHPTLVGPGAIYTNVFTGRGVNSLSSKSCCWCRGSLSHTVWARMSKYSKHTIQMLDTPRLSHSIRQFMQEKITYKNWLVVCWVAAIFLPPQLPNLSNPRLNSRGLIYGRQSIQGDVVCVLVMAAPVHYCGNELWNWRFCTSPHFGTLVSLFNA